MAATEKNKFRLNKYISPVFVSMLVISLVLWYLTKLSYTYTAEIPIDIDIEGNKFRVSCLAEGTGYRLVSHRYFKSNEIDLNFRDIQATPSVFNAGSYIVNTYSLQNAISIRTTDLRIISVGDIPEIKIPYVD